MNPAKAARPPHTPGAPVLVWFEGGHMDGRSMTVGASFTGTAPTVIHLHEPQPITLATFDGPASAALKIVTYHLVATLDTVPHSYLYRLNGA